MRNLFLASILVLTFCICSFAQTNETLPCPSFQVLGQTDAPNPGDNITFTANVINYDASNVIYNWTVSAGEILHGQGTATISVSTKKGEDINTIATVEILGLPKHCCRAESATIALNIDWITILADEFSISAPRIDETRLDNLAVQLQETPTATIFIFERFERTNSRTVIEQKISKTLDYLVNNKRIDSKQIVIGIDKADENSTQFFIVPNGVEKPDCNDCVILDNQNFKQQLKELFISKK